MHGRQAQGQTVLSAPFSVSAGKLAPHNLSLTPHMLLLTPQLKLVPTPQSLADLQPPLIQRTQRKGSSGPRPQRARSFPFLPQGTSSPRPPRAASRPGRGQRWVPGGGQRHEPGLRGSRPGCQNGHVSRDHGPFPHRGSRTVRRRPAGPQNPEE